MSNIIKIQGVVDPHVHLRDLEWSHKATFFSETCAAVAGGYWAIFDMPNTPPTTTTYAALNQKIVGLAQNAVCDWGIYAGASQADNTAEYEKMIQSTCGLKIFNNATTGDLLISDQSMRDKHYNYWGNTRIIAVHAEGETVLEILELVRKYRHATHFLHISTAEEIRFLQQAKQEGLPITIGVCPHHLYLTESDIPSLGAYGLMKPTLKTANDRDTLWQALQQGVIDVIESDHAPHTHEEKRSDKPPYGVTGLETTLPLVLTAVSEKRISLEKAVDCLSTASHRIWKISPPPETYTLIDLDETYMLENNSLHTACKWSPYEGMKVKGKIVETWIRGTKVFDGESVCVPRGFGQNLFGES